MLLLALDTSTNQSTIALCSEHEIYGEYSWYSANNHSVELLRNVQRLFVESQMTMQQLDVVAVATGPGSFNGVRVALTTAKTFSFSLKKRLVGVSTLDCIAAQQQHWQGPICAVLEAGRSELYAACYLFERQESSHGDVLYRMRQLGDYLLLSPQHLATYVQEQGNSWLGVPGVRGVPPFLFCGEMSPASYQALRTHMGERSLFVGRVQSTRRASVLAMLALQRLEDGKEDDPLLLEPLYLRRPSITTSTRKQPLLGGTSLQSSGYTTTEREEGALRH
ncbi:MAG TPA: tRNA (adenosine(37)-N6)-threonylcarbamoyltransferase complex dimerization subunit type 1 TsaB [Ktedonosporobacter sp.]|nr:tRNA (adenosine(37)-N6)-threonylcarbamoyltransferase complex dimerization subunit type 1 TsaB [Ktedonosporobacter sp.]